MGRGDCWLIPRGEETDTIRQMLEKEAGGTKSGGKFSQELTDKLTEEEQRGSLPGVTRVSSKRGDGHGGEGGGDEGGHERRWERKTGDSAGEWLMRKKLEAVEGESCPDFISHCF